MDRIQKKKLISDETLFTIPVDIQKLNNKSPQDAPKLSEKRPIPYLYIRLLCQTNLFAVLRGRNDYTKC